MEPDPSHGLDVHVPVEVASPVLSDDLQGPELGFVLGQSQRMTATLSDAGDGHGERQAGIQPQRCVGMAPQCDVGGVLRRGEDEHRVMRLAGNVA